MIRAGATIAAALALGVLAMAEEKKDAPAGAEARSVYDFTVKTIDGEEVKLDKYKGDVLLIVNVASKCGLTDSNYKELEPLYQKYKEQGFTILAFPANDFGAQEPGTNEEIKAFCAKYKVSFPLFAKIAVKGDEQAPLYRYLTTHPDESIRGDVQWNFQKYLVGRDGKVLKKFSPRTAPNDAELTAAVEEALKAPKA